MKAYTFLEYYIFLAVEMDYKENQVGHKFDYLFHRSHNTREIGLIGYPYKPIITIIWFGSENK